MTATMWKDVRRGTSAGVTSLVELGVRHGLTAGECLRGSGVSADHLDGEPFWVVAEQELVVIANLVRRLGDPPGLGVEAGRAVNMGNLGIFGFALMSSAHLAEAFELAARYALLTNTCAGYVVQRTTESLALVCDFNDLGDDVRAFVIERDLTVVAGIVPMVLGTVAVPRVEVELGADRAALLAAELPADEFVPAATRTALVVPADWAARRPIHADIETVRDCVEQCERLLDSRALDTRSLVRTLLHQRGRTVRSLTALADELHIDRRTLQRRLAREGTTFRTLLDDAMRTLAAELLMTTQYSVAQVAGLLGYAETASFTHAFIRWHGTSPGRFRAHRR
ncbi:AraC family transcriptional regulator ligand-binding domain-containing protein [Nocardia sp. NPDC056952]|uniref:AraC family transcriptional regulator n=1 Tax=Nocardia sp. NPDC056952 TaxID=3345979 RepID=UPI00363589E6